VIDLNNCKQGDSLTLQDGRQATYVRKMQASVDYPHLLRVPEGILTANTSGYVYSGAWRDPIKIVRIS